MTLFFAAIGAIGTVLSIADRFAKDRGRVKTSFRRVSAGPFDVVIAEFALEGDVVVYDLELKGGELLKPISIPSKSLSRLVSPEPVTEWRFEVGHEDKVSLAFRWRFGVQWWRPTRRARFSCSDVTY